MSDALAVAIGEALGEPVTDLAPVAGGDLNDAYRVTLPGGRRAFAKTSPDAAPGAYADEAAGLRWLGAAGALPVPEVLAVDDAFLVLVWVDGDGRVDDAALGRGLAQLHRAGADRHGVLPPGARGPFRIGPVTFPDEPAADWGSFYAANRLLPLVRRAADAGALEADGVRAVESVAGRIAELAGPREPVARLHGDLWSGNVHAGADGRAWLIDPAAHGGHREVDLAMLQLFGRPAPTFFDAYDEVWPRADGHADRVSLWQLLPLLVHAVLFGGSYGAAVRRAAQRYT